MASETTDHYFVQDSLAKSTCFPVMDFHWNLEVKMRATEANLDPTVCIAQKGKRVSLQNTQKY